MPGASSRKSFLKEINFTDRKSLCLRLDNRDDWKKIVGLIKCRDDNTKPRYGYDHIQAFTQESMRYKGSPTSALISDWCTQLPTIEDFLDVLKEARLYDTANYVVQNILGERPLRIPTEDEVSDNEVINQFDGSMTGRGPLTFKLDVDRFQSSSRNTDPITRSSSDDASAAMDLQSEKYIYDSIKNAGVTVFNYSDLVQYTDNFNDKPLTDGGRLIGEGGFGEVFLGTKLNSDGTTECLAIKRLLIERDSTKVTQFIKELCVTVCNHPNLLAIKGVCYEKAFCIIYEYMSQGSLDKHLGEPASKILTAKQRLNIAIDIAKGIQYLHTFNPNKPILHRDIKSANVLLDDEMNAKIGDFGLARLHDGVGTMTTSTVIGSTHYMPPEAFEGKVSSKWDVFSFGVVLLELLTGKEPMASINEGEEKQRLMTFIFEEDDFPGDKMTLVDPLADWNVDVAHQLFDIIEKCGLKKTRRPEIGQVLEKLLPLQDMC